MATGKQRRRFDVGGRANAAAFSHDGKALAVATAEGVIRVWDPATLKETTPAAGVPGGLVPFGFLPDGKSLAVGWPTGLAFWQVAEPARDAERWSVREARRLETSLAPLAVSPDGKLAVVGQSYQAYHLWDVEKGAELRKIDDRDLGTVVFAPDGKVLATFSFGRPTLLDVGTGKPLRQMGRLSANRVSMAFSPDGKLLATVGTDGDDTLRFWDVALGKELSSARIVSEPDRQAYGRSVVYAPTGKMLAVGDDGEGVRLWDVAAGKFVGTREGGRVSAFSPDGKLLASTTHDGTIRLWEVATGKSVGELKGHEGRVTSLLFSPDGHLLVSASADHTILLWDLQAKK